MEDLEIEIVVINGKKHPYCSKLILYIHLVLAMMISVFSSYYLSQLTRLRPQRRREPDRSDRQLNAHRH